jgi:hypothetical protein
VTMNIEQERRPEHGKEHLAAERRWRFHDITLGASDDTRKGAPGRLATEFNDPLAMAVRAREDPGPMRGGNPDGWVVHFRFGSFQGKETRARS